MRPLIRLGANGQPTLVCAPPRAPQARVAPDPGNSGRGDARKGISPNVKLATTPSVADWEHGSLVRLSDWLAEGKAPGRERAPVGLVLMGDEDPSPLAARFEGLAMIAIDFPKFTDGRGYSLAALVRRMGWRGELRAVGDVLRDQLYLMARCGFDSFALRPDQDGEAALAAFADFPDFYQAGGDGLAPLFRRRSP